MPSSGCTYLCEFDVLEEDDPRRFEVEGVPATLVLSGKEVFAIHDVCSHSAVSLSEKEVDGCTVECWLHGSRFDLRTGKPIGPPATDPVATFPVEVRGDDVYVDTAAPLNGVQPS